MLTVQAITVFIDTMNTCSYFVTLNLISQAAGTAESDT